ncbi:MAG TPA: CNNM domain-containing protein [Candidatus Paceibacterota bacterium]|nr:CNNM domain-containing protein [Candidatus Paceibacterota bacterium]
MDKRVIIAFVLAVITVALSAVFSGMETGIYRLSRLRLRLRTEQGSLSYRLLSRAMRDGPALLLSLLVGNNLVNYLATSCITYLFLTTIASESTAQVLAASLTAPLLFIFGESLPKNIFLYRADTLTARFGPFLFATHQVLKWSGIVPVLKAISQLVARLIGAPIPSGTMISSQSHHVRAILRDTQEEGLLSRVQMEMIDRVVNIPGLRLHAVMVPLDHVRSVSVRSSRETLLNELRNHVLTRLLVWQETPTNILGYINIYDVLGSDEPFESLEEFVVPIRGLDADTPIIETIDLMRKEELRIVLVTRERARRVTPVGIVTMKDLVEELLGELAEW